jgi:hypothetical protein
MNKKSILLMLLLTLSIMLPVFTMKANAYPVTATPSTFPQIVEWVGNGSNTVWTGTGLKAYETLKWNPEYLKVQVWSEIETETTIIIQGKDTIGENIEAKAVIPEDAVMQSIWIFNDTHTDPPKPVAFAEITGILQQGGTDNTKFLIYTEPEPFEEYLGQYHFSTGFEPGKYDGSVIPVAWNQFLVGHGPDTPYTVQDVPVQPSNPDPFKIVVNWVDKPNLLGISDLLPTANEFPNGGALTDSTVYLESLDENGNKVITPVFIPATTTITGPITGCTYSTFCKVWGGLQGISYYIFTEPMPQRALFYYYIKIDHITIHPESFDILAYPDYIDPFGYPGVTDITVALRDIDGNLVNAEDYGTINGIDQKIIVNFFTSGGIIQPSRATIKKEHSTLTVNITADTNPRTIKVTADANIPPSAWHDAMNLFTWTEMTFDGINSVLSTVWPIHKLMCGYTDVTGTPTTMAAPFKQWLPPELGGPVPDGIKLDGPLYEVMIPLYVGCNLISSPVYPMLGYDQYQLGQGIPMDLLFGKTSAIDTIEAIWWIDPIDDPAPAEPLVEKVAWHTYIPGIPDPTAFFRDGIGYWIKAEKSATLELSGVAMENAPFIPCEYPVHRSWNLMGFTSIGPMKTDKYLESLATDTHYDVITGSGSVSIASAVGPIWVYDAPSRTWTRDPDWLWPTQGFWMNYKLPGYAFLAP